MKMGDLSRLTELINDPEFWGLLYQIGDRRTMKMMPETIPPSIYFECADSEGKIVDLSVFSFAAPGMPSSGITYRMHVRTPNGTLYESNPDTIRAGRLKKSLKEVTELLKYYGGLAC